MRLICGLLRLDAAPAGAGLLDGMIAALMVPGQTPSVRRHVDGPVALAVLDFCGDRLDEAALPASESGLRLAADVRLDRPRELASRLGLPADAGAEVLTLAGFERWGLDLVEHLDGDHALAAWDPHARRLTLLRDTWGVRPICYAHVPGQAFLFASLPQGIIGSGLVPAKPDVVALGYQVIRRPCLGTGLKDIHWLPPNGGVEVTSSGPGVLRAAPQFDVARIGRWRGSPEDAAAALRQLLEDAVACRIARDRPAAAHLSGGLDSSAVAVIAARVARQRGIRLHAYSHLDDPASGLADPGERPFIQAVLDQEHDVSWAAVHLPPLDGDIPLSIERLSDGLLRSPDDELYAAAASAGVRMMQSGLGGDETATYHGRNIHLGLLHEMAWPALVDDLRRRARRQGRSAWRLAGDTLIRPLVPDGVARRWRRGSGTARRRPLIEHLSYLDRDVADAVRESLPRPRNLWGRPADRLTLLTHATQERATIFAMHAARHGAAVSHPMLDRRVVDFALSLPLARMVDGGYSRQPFRHAMQGVLPDAVRWREHKLAGYPDAGIKLVAAKRGLLARVEQLRSQPAAAFVDLAAIATALRALPDTGTPQSPVFSEAVTAYVALTAAWNVARLEGGLEVP